MPKIYYSRSKHGFFSDQDFGELLKSIPDPADPTASILVENEECKLPSDVIEITAEQHSAFLTPEAGKTLSHPTDEMPEGLPFFADIVDTTDPRDVVKVTRYAAINAALDVSGQTFQVDQSSRDNMTNVIGYATRNAVDPAATQAWILADNTVVMVTVANLQAVLDAYTLRMGVIYAAYGVWAAGAMTSHFVTP